jgi:integrase
MSDPTPIKAQPHHGYESWTTGWRDDNKRSHTKRFGRVGKVSKTEAKLKFEAWKLTVYPKLKAKQAAPAPRYTVAQLCKDYFAEVKKRYVGPDGRHTTSVNRHKVMLESFAGMYGAEEADDMTAGKVAAWLESFVAKRRRKGVGEGAKTKHTVNLALSYLKRTYRWAMTYKGVNPNTAGAVNLVQSLGANHPDVRRKDPIRAVAWETVDATCKHLPADVKNAVLLQWWTGMRPGEVLSMRPADLNTTDDVWVYRPAHHKTSWRGKERFVVIGPEAKAILKPLLPSRTDAPVFPGVTGQGYRRALVDAAEAAGVPSFTPNQLRHALATRVRMLKGAAAVQDLLGHASLNQQQVYVDDALERAKRLAREVG